MSSTPQNGPRGIFKEVLAILANLPKYFITTGSVAIGLPLKR